MFTPGRRDCWQVFGLAGLARSKETGVSTDPSSRFWGKPVVFGCSSLLTAAGQFRICAGFPFRRFPWKRHQQLQPNIKGCTPAVNLNLVVSGQAGVGNPPLVIFV